MNLVDYDKRYRETTMDPAVEINANREFIIRYTSLAGGSGSLLDVGCGLGLWSLALAEWYNVIGIDNCETAIRRARQAQEDIDARITNRRCLFVCADVLEEPIAPVDVMFCKAPEFFSVNPVESGEFKQALDYLISNTLKIFVLFLFTAPPFERYVSTDPSKPATSYMQEPRKVHHALRNYGEVSTRVYGNRLVSELILEG